MLAKLESLFHRLRRRFSRSEWAIRHLGFEPSQDTEESPGLLLVQIDGLSRSQVERAMQEGRMPFLRQLMAKQRYQLRTFYSGLPSTTPAVQAEIYYGRKAAVPSFSFREEPDGGIVSMFDSELVKKYEAALASENEGLLQGGSSWSNIYSGGASPEETHFCVASIGWGDIWRTKHIWNLFLFALLQAPALVRITGLVVLELFIGLFDALAGILRGQHFGMELGMLLSRMCVGIGLREVVTIGGKVDLARGLPSVHINLLGYDELSHRRGPSSRFAHWSLRGIDRAIRDLHRSAHRSRRRDYQVWIFSDHGQQTTVSYDEKRGEPLKAVVGRLLDRMDETSFVSETPTATGPLPRRNAHHRSAPPELRGPEPFQIAAMGPVGHLYLRDSIDDAGKVRLARQLISKEQMPGVILKMADGKIRWFHEKGETSVPGEVASLLDTHPSYLRSVIAEDLVALVSHEKSGDLVLIGWNPWGKSWTFVPERGSHAGFGPEETQGFLMVPPSTRFPSEADEFVRPRALREAALDLLERRPVVRPSSLADGFTSSLSIMSYNVHSCIGMDGRVSPRRIARVIAGENPDLIALQELEHGRSRSRGEDQALAIADHIGYHLVFCPTVVRQAERYGHAVLSRHPLETIKVGNLPGPGAKWWPEPRGALWCRALVNGQKVNILTTHLGLSATERLAQMNALLGPEWLGPILEKEPVILCGDLNCTPGSPPWRLATLKLIDVAVGVRHPLNTFASNYPLVRLDHIFVSKHFGVEKSEVVRNDLTRVASDHLPLLSALRADG